MPRKRQRRFLGVVDAILPEQIGRLYGPGVCDRILRDAPDPPSILITIQTEDVHTFVLYRVVVRLDGYGRIVAITQDRWAEDR